VSTQTEAGNPGLRDDDMRLMGLADHLDYKLADRLRTLVEADSMAHRVDDLVSRAERAEDLAAECQRQLRALDRQLTRVRDENELLKRRVARAER